MKKTQNLLLLAVLFVSAFFVVGKVSAADAGWGFKETKIYCNPEALEPGGTAKCYYAGKPTTGAGYVAANAGFWTKMYTTDNLIIQSVTSNAANGAAQWYDSASSSESIQLASGMPSQLASFTCGQVTTKDTKSQGCGIWYTKSGSDPAYSPSTLTANGLKASDFKVSSLDGYAVLGYVTVKLDNNNDVDKCGNICIVSYGIPTDADWAHYKCVNESITGCDDTYVTKSTKTEGGSEDEFDCYELHIKTVDPGNYPETGAFVSYAILAAAALIALSAVTIAKKHNRLQKI